MASKSNNLVDNIVDTQKKVLDSVLENTKKFTNGNSTLNETIEKGSDWYKNWLESQKTLFTKASGFTNGKADTTEHKAENNSENGNAHKPNEILENWMSTQAAWAKQIWDMSQEAAKKFGPGTNTNPFAAWTGGSTANPFANWTNPTANPFAAFTGANNANPFAAWTNTFNTANNPMGAWANQMNATNWMNQMQQMNPMNNETIKTATDTATNMFNQFVGSINSTYADWQKNFENGTVQDAFKNMTSSAEGFTKFAELWMPMIKSMQDKTFTAAEYKKMMNPETYKEFMDKFFGFMPESGRDFATKMSGMMTDNMKKATDSGMNSYHQMRDMMNNMPGVNPTQMMSGAYSAYNDMQGKMNEAFAPFTKLVAPNAQTKAMQEWKDLSDRIMAYNVKNAELQYMIYAQGTKVMDKLADNVAKKIQEGHEVTSLIDLYQEWLNTSDKVYVSLFESTEYSELMAEVGAMQMKLRRDMELQGEKMLKDVPVATRSQMDDVYKTIYDLKKKVRQLEKMLDLEVEETEETPTDAAEKKTAKKSAKK